ncbi:MAG TPA: NHLP bacteriocin system secretion protein [Candidatus Cybelea sp.]|nr:NHLP bacteriocin system secretion protein [Candidatus Cybelea sp.]
MAATSSERIFRTAAIERLASPEQLDRLISLTSPMGWLAALVLVLIVAGTIGWSVFGVLPRSVYGSGILVTQGGHVFDAMSPVSGTLISVADIGTQVKKGDLLASLDDTDLKQALDHAAAVVREKQSDLESLTANYAQQIDLKHKNAMAQRANLEKIIAADQQRSAFYRDLLEKQSKIVAQGFLTQRFQEETRRSMDEADQEARSSQSDLLRLDAEEGALQGQRDLAVLDAQQAVSEAQRKVDELKTQLDEASRIVSPLDGVITEVKASAGTVVAPGRPIVSIETAGSGLELMLYVPPEYGKRVAPGMDVRIEPATVKKEEFGTLIGRVVAVSDFPMTAEGMASVLQNPELVQRFMEQGPPYAVRVALMPEPSTATGYRWSGGPGPPLRLSSGTTATAAVTISRRAPITLLIPLLKGQAGLSS